MKYKKIGGSFVVRIDKGEEIVKNLTRLAKREKITTGHILAIGAVLDPTLRFFDPRKKKYNDKILRGHYEITNLTGNFSVMNGAPYLHLHITLTDKNFRALGGHLLKARVGGIFEAFIEKLPGRIGRKFSQNTGLNLFEF